jgi:hypothetical protein
VHAKLARGTALVPIAFLENVDDEAFLKLADSFGIENSAFVHLCDKRFKLVLHVVSLFLI